MLNHTRRSAFIEDKDSALARFLRATAAVQGFILDMTYHQSRKVYYMRVVMPSMAVEEWLRLQEPARRPKTEQPKTRRMPPAGCPLAEDK
jgi:hypothetical protein